MATPQGKTASKKYIKHTKHGDLFRVPGLQPEYLPIRQQHTYLGCVVSLFDFEAATLRHRVQTGRTQYQRLKRILCSRRCMSLNRRARLWSTCVWTTISYGLSCCGLPSSSLKTFQRVVNLQLRSISRLPSHVTHVTTEELYQRLHLQHSPSPLMRAAMRSSQVSPSGPQLLQQAEHARDLLTESAGHAGKLQRVSQNEGAPCPRCGLYFQGQTAVKIHIRRMHPEIQPHATSQPKSLSRYDIGVDGMPTCRFCGHVFGAWKDLVNHVAKNQCHGGQPRAVETTEPLPLVQRALLVQTWIDGGAVRLARDLTVDIRAELLQRCCLCRQWIASPSHIKSHIRRSHPTVFEAYFQDITQQCGLMSSLIHDPCPFCLQPVQSKHRDRHATCCPVLLQVALCCVQNGHDTARRNRLTLRGTLACLPGQSSARPAGLSGSGQLSEHSGTNTHRGGKPSSQVAETERQGGSATAVAAGKPRSFLLEWMERQQPHPATSSAGKCCKCWHSSP